MTEVFSDLLLRYRARARLTQRELATRAGAAPRSVQDWEAGVTHPTVERLQGLIAALLAAGALTAGYEREDADALWSAVERESPRMHAAFDVEWFADLLYLPPAPGEASRAERSISRSASVASAGERHAAERREEWGEAPDVRAFVGRSDELLLLSTWLLDSRCRLLAILGMGGIGKTALSSKLARDVADRYERVYWRSLRDAPLVSDLLAGAIGFLSDQQLAPPVGDSERIRAFLQLLRERRCLVILDNFETLFEPHRGDARYRDGMAGYGRLIQAIAEAAHRSCAILTSREAPPELAAFAGETVRTFRLGGLGVDDGQTLLAAKRLEGTPEQWAELIARYGGNGLALRVVGERIRELFNGDIGAYL
ncbi:MAG: NACHT domain-containing protein, partial [Chloroflexi bacterium]|nr:NACHT domain-containing protein [Chloroflexota bacterium]